MSESKKKQWSELTDCEKAPYIKKADYLIHKGYSQEKDLYKLAETIYNKSSG